MGIALKYYVFLLIVSTWWTYDRCMRSLKVIYRNLPKFPNGLIILVVFAAALIKEISFVRFWSSRCLNVDWLDAELIFYYSIPDYFLHIHTYERLSVAHYSCDNRKCFSHTSYIIISCNLHCWMIWKCALFYVPCV